jgi:Beta-galactosidase/Carbohydrate binding domain
VRRNRIILGLALCWSLTASGAENLVRNGGFEDGMSSWQFLVTGAQASGAVDGAEAHEGKHSFKLVNNTGQSPNVYARVVQTITGLRPFTTYRISCWAKGRGCGNNWIGGGPGWYTRAVLPTGDFDWRQISIEVNCGADANNYDLMVLTESPTTALWVDDIRFEPVSVDKAKQDAALAQKDAAIADFERRVNALTNTGDAYVRLGKAVANRFIDFAKNAGQDGQMSRGWVNPQLEEVAQVLDETEKLAKENSPLFEWMPPKIGAIKYKDGTFYNDDRPFYFYGYGHFDSVINDLPNFPALGASLIQDGRSGPSSMEANGTLGAGARTVLDGLDRAAQYGMKVDFLLSPHYYPAWAQAPDVPNGNIGFIKFNIYHPWARQAVSQWATVMAEHLKDKPALFSVCLANEPVYNSGGRDKYTQPMFIDFLRHRFNGNLALLNALYGTAYKSFDQAVVPACAMPADVPAKRAYYDWTCFNKKLFADWHAWMGSTLKANGLKAPTHTKIMVFQTLDRDKVGWGVDPELMCHATDLAGCDAYAFLGGAYDYDWIGHEFFYDLLHSFRGQSVFNSENHLIPDGSPHNHIPLNHSRAVIWQDGLHHEGSSTIWVWQMTSEEGGGSGLGGSIYFRPANIYGAGRAMLDLNRLAPEVTAINHARPRVALLDSQPSIFWEDRYKGTLFSIYTALTFMGEPVTFISERQLADGAVAPVDWLIAANATHILDTTPAALEAFKKKGGNILLVGKDSLTRDEYDRPFLRKVGDYPVIEPGPDDRATAALLRAAIIPLQTPDLRQAADGQPSWGIEYRIVPMGNATLVPLINFKGETQTVKLPKWSNHTALDLLSGETVKLNSISLEPMLPRLLRIAE